MEMRCPEFLSCFLVPASPCISQKAGWAFSLILSKCPDKNPALLMLLIPRTILRENLSDSRAAAEVKALLTLKGTLSERALFCTALMDWFPGACTFTDHFLITFPLPSISVFPPFPAIPYTSPATCSHLMDWLLKVLILTWHGPFLGNKWCHTDTEWCPDEQPRPICSSAQVQSSRDGLPVECWCLEAVKLRKEKLKQKWRILLFVWI